MKKVSGVHWLLAFGVWLLAGCVPMQTQAPTLRDEAGFVIAGDVYRSALFDVKIPEGWRIVTSESNTPPSLMMVAPDDCALIQVSSTPLENAPISPTCEGAVRSEIETVQHGASTLYIGASAPAEAWAGFVTVLEGVRESVEG